MSYCSRTGLWGGRLGNHRLYPEAHESCQTTRVAVSSPSSPPQALPSIVRLSMREKGEEDTTKCGNGRGVTSSGKTSSNILTIRDEGRTAAEQFYALAA